MKTLSAKFHPFVRVTICEMLHVLEERMPLMEHIATFSTFQQNKPARWSNYANPVYDVATICHQVRLLRWGHPSLFHTATSLLIWYKMFCVREISYRLIWMECINMFSMYAQSGNHSRFNWWIIVVLTYNPSVLMCVEITDAPKL